VAINCTQVNPSPRHLDDNWSDPSAEAEQITGRALEVLQVDPRCKLVAVLGHRGVLLFWSHCGQTDWIPLYRNHDGSRSVNHAAITRRVPLFWGCM
jgi:hypothetical protein